MSALRPIHPDSVPAPVGNYVHGAEVAGSGRLLFISGQIPEAADGTVPAGFEAQCRLVWSHVGATLSAAGLSYPNLVKVTTYLSDVSLADVNARVRREVLGAHAPALTVVGAATLDRRWLLEIEAVAWGPSR